MKQEILSTLFIVYFYVIHLFRHLHNVGHVGKLVIAVEEAVAKGIRRIIAFTGPEASRAIYRADRIEQRVEEVNDELVADHLVTLDKTEFKAATKKVLELFEVGLYIF